MEIQVKKVHELVQLRVGQPANNTLTEVQLKRECLSIISRSFLYSTPNGQTEQTVLEFQTLELLRILKRFGSLTIPEVQTAFRNGLDGIYGQYFGMCGKTYTQFLNGFMNNPERSKAWLDYLNDIDKPKVKEVPEKIKGELSKQFAIDIFNEYKQTGHLGMVGEIMGYRVYDFIKESKGVKTLITLEQFKEIDIKTRPEFEANVKKEKEKAEHKRDHDLAKALGDILINGVEKSKTLQTLQKKMALKVYFDGIKELGI